MENLFAPRMLPNLRREKVSIALPPDRKFQQIAVEDIGSFVAEMISLGPE